MFAVEHVRCCRIPHSPGARLNSPELTGRDTRSREIAVGIVGEVVASVGTCLILVDNSSEGFPARSSSEVEGLEDLAGRSVALVERPYLFTRLLSLGSARDGARLRSKTSREKTSREESLANVTTSKTSREYTSPNKVSQEAHLNYFFSHPPHQHTTCVYS